MSSGPVEVGVLTIAPAPVTLTEDLPGRTSAYRVAEVRARVDGIVHKRLFNEGSDVKEGDVLYEIDPAPYEASLNSAQATLARAEANVATARAKEQRYQSLLSARAISKQEYDDAVASLRSSEADIASGKAAVETARINLGYTKVTAPVSGRIGLSQVTEGAYVQASAATLLATIQQLDPINVDVTKSSTEFQQLMRSFASGQIKREPNAAGRARVKLIFEDGSVYSEEGSLAVADVSVNQTTSSVTLRAVFPNPHNELLPGLFVRARIQQGSVENAILVPQQAVTRNAKGEPTLFVVGDGNKAQVRVIETSRSIGNQWMVSSGLKAGDKVIVDNLQRVRAGAEVKAISTASAATQTATAASSPW
jgi:membrane fusion protein (multidrug efflux system)